MESESFAGGYRDLVRTIEDELGVGLSIDQARVGETVELIVFAPDERVLSVLGRLRSMGVPARIDPDGSIRIRADKPCHGAEERPYVIDGCLNLAVGQQVLGQWSRGQFGGVDEQPARDCLLGALEELGEVSRLVLKGEQEIRQDELGDADLEMEVADVVLYLLDFCDRSGVDLECGVVRALDKVLERDFRGGGS